MASIFIKTTKEELVKPISVTTGVIERKQTMPILGNVLIRKSGANITFIGSDMQLQVKIAAPIGAGKEKVATTVSAKKLAEILNTFGDEDEVTLTTDKNLVRVLCGKSKFELQTLPADNYPEMKEDDSFVKAFTMPCIQFKDLLTKVQFASDVTNNRPYLKGVLLDVEEKKVKAVATDGHRMAYFENDLDEPCEKVCKAILTKKTTKELMRLIPDSDEALEVYISDNQVKVKFGLIEILSALVEGKYPDYERVIPKKNSKIFTVNKAELTKSLQKVAILTTEQSRNVCWALTPGSLAMTARNTEMEEAFDEIPAEYDGEPLEIYFNVGLFLDMLNVVKTESLKISLETPMSSGLVQMADSERFKYVIMPVRS